MAPEQVINRLVVSDKLAVEGRTQLNETKIRGALTVGDALTKDVAPAHLCGDLNVDGVINGKLAEIIKQINAGEGFITAERIDPSLLEDLRARLARALTFLQGAIAVAVIALLIAIIALFL